MKTKARVTGRKKARPQRTRATAAPSTPERPKRAASPANGEAKIRWLLHELQVHSEEVTVQNEQLIKAQAEIEQARDRYAELYDFAPVGYATLDSHGAIHECNFAASTMLGRPRHFLLRVPLTAFVVREDRTRLRDFLHQAALHPDQAATIDIKIKTAPNRRLRLLTKARPAGPTAHLLFTAMVDITAELLLAESRSQELLREQARGRELADEVADSAMAQQRIKALMERLVTVQEEERRRLARDLHDHLGQQLTALRLEMSMLRHLGGPEIQPSLASAEAIAERLDRDVDYLAWSLRPAALDEFGLSAALQTYVKQWADHHHIRAEMVTRAPAQRVQAEVENHLYRVVQEALNNIAKHAQATEALVRLDGSETTLRVTVQDNGVGFDPTGNRARGMGLLSMRERVALIGGTIHVESGTGRGTRITVRVPLQHAAAAHQAGLRDQP